MRQPTSNTLNAAPCRRRTGGGLEGSSASGGYGRKCKRQFDGGRHPSGDRFQDAVMAGALRRFHRGFTYREMSAGLIRRHKTCAAEISPSTIMKRVDQYTKVATAEADELEACTGDTWFTGHLYLDNRGNTRWQVFTQLGELSPNLAPVTWASCGRSRAAHSNAGGAGADGFPKWGIWQGGQHR